MVRGGHFRSPVGAWLRKVRAMPKDVGFWIVLGALLLAVGVFVFGLLRQRGLGGYKGVPDAVMPPELPNEAAGPPPLPEEWTPYSTGSSWAGEASPVALSGPMRPGWWRVSSNVYNWYDLLLAGFIATIYLLPMFMGGQPEVKVTFSVALSTILTQLFLMAMVIGFVAWRQNPSRWLGLRWPMWPLVFPIAIVGVLFTWGVLGVLQMVGFIDWLQSLLGNDGKQDVVKAFTEADSPLLLATLVVMAVVVAPLTEEVMFRGYFYPVAKRYIGRAEAIIFSSLVFAVIHHNAMALLPLFVLAVLLALAYEFTGSIWAPIGIHTLFNGATVGAQLAIKYGLIQEPGP
jgi:uncharacterized protein